MQVTSQLVDVVVAVVIKLYSLKHLQKKCSSKCITQKMTCAKYFT